MGRAWQLQKAKNHFSEVVDDALKCGPQTITRHGVETAIVLSVKDYKKLTKPRQGLVDFFKSSPLHGVSLDLERSRDLPRKVDL